MILSSISLTNFRNYSKASFAFSPQTTLIVGPNTSGKTNILEAIYLLATGKSHRALYDREMIRKDENFAIVNCQLSTLKDEKTDLEVTIIADQNHENVSHKRFKVNGVKKSLSGFLGKLNVSLFSPEDLNLVTDSPALRRGYLDSVLSQTDKTYRQALIAYRRVLRQRNRLLWQIREGVAKEGQLGFWNGKLLEFGQILGKGRLEFINFANEYLREVGRKLLGSGSLELEYKQSILSKEYLDKYGKQEIAAGMTLWGPHRDDFSFTRINADKNARLPAPERSDGGQADLRGFGSRGEQRLAILALKLSELEFMKERVGEYPCLLLDDVFSELDKNHREFVLKVIPRQQTIITTTDRGLVEKGWKGGMRVIELGKV